MAHVADGILDIAIVYAPRYRAGLKVELVSEERLVLVTTPPRGSSAADPDYVYVDWGPEFAVQHHMNFPERTDPGFFVGLGPLGLSYILAVGGSGYFRLGAVRRHLASGKLELVRNAPEFLYPAYAVYAEGGDLDLIQTALTGLRHAASPNQIKSKRSQAAAPQQRRSPSTGDIADHNATTSPQRDGGHQDKSTTARCRRPRVPQGKA
jgi:DNA-binding transcriptional LysR family regulator